MLIKNGTIIDGTGRKKKYKADLRIVKDKIKEIGNLSRRNREEVIDAAGLYVAPGFIDILNKSDIHFSIFENPSLKSVVKQGVTTIMGGGCGSSLAPLSTINALKSIQKWQDISRLNINWSDTSEFLEELERHNLNVNFGTLTGHSTLRRGLFGDSFAPLDEPGLKKMAYMLEKSLEQGSFGLSTGLAYSHAKPATQNELKRLATIVKNKNALYATHLRNEAEDLVVSVNETVSLAEETSARTHIFHFKALGKNNWGEFPRSLEMIESSQESGSGVTFDIYPYTATASVLYLLLPGWIAKGGRSKVLEKLKDETVRRKAVSELSKKTSEISEIIIASGKIDKIFLGKPISEIALNQNVSAPEALLNIILASGDRVIGFMPAVDEKNIKLAIKNNFSIIASDGIGAVIKNAYGAGLMHPRVFGTFPRFLGKYVRQEKLLKWEEAIAKITSFPAEIIGLKNRGKIERGYFADIAVFNPKNILDRATLQDPFQYSVGIKYTIVNGKLSLNEGRFTKERGGKILRK